MPILKRWERSQSNNYNKSMKLLIMRRLQYKIEGPVYTAHLDADGYN